MHIRQPIVHCWVTWQSGTFLYFLKEIFWTKILFWPFVECLFTSNFGSDLTVAPWVTTWADLRSPFFLFSLSWNRKCYLATGMVGEQGRGSVNSAYCFFSSFPDFYYFLPFPWLLFFLSFPWFLFFIPWFRDIFQGRSEALWALKQDLIRVDLNLEESFR